MQRSRTLTLASVLFVVACDGSPPNSPDVDPDDPGDQVADHPATTAELAPVLPATPYSYAEEVLPAAFQVAPVVALDNTPADNPITDAGATLGRVLFHDVALSANRSIACASCHVQAAGFSDPERLSLGFEGGHTGRHSMSLTDARFYQSGRFFWDERAATLEDQVLMPIQDATEMGMTLDELVERVASLSYYPPLFAAAFGDGEVTSARIALALAQYVRSIVSYRTRYDVALATETDPREAWPQYTTEENRGKELFFGQAGCAACHVRNPPPGAPGPRNFAVFFVDRPTNNGLDDGTEADADRGVGTSTASTLDDGRFKSPSLRNVALTAPYMHDGRFATLNEVVEHYNTGVKTHPNLDPRMRAPDGTPRRLNLSVADVDAIVAFLHTLTDDELTLDPRFSNPFPR